MNILASLFLILVCFGEYHRRGAAGTAHASQGLLSILANISFGCNHLDSDIRSNFKSELCSSIGIDAADLTRAKGPQSINLKCLIMDFSALSYIDPSGVLALKQLVSEFNKISVNVYVAAASCKQIKCLSFGI